jgi:predicted MFS family arabinose efflux permease
MWHTLVHHRAFRRLWIAATVDACGSWLLVMAVPVQVFALTGSATSTGLALAIEALPAALIAPWAGIVTDRFPRGRVLVTANLVSAAGVALMLVASTPGRVGFVYVGLVLESVASCFARPAFQAATPGVVADASTLASANALLATSNSVWRIAGPIAGTSLTAVGWFPAVVGLDLASFLVAAAIVRTVPIPAAGRADDSGLRVSEGLRHIGGTRTLRGLLVSSCLYWTANAGLTALLVPFVTERLHAPGGAVGYLITGLGVGYLCGSALSRRVLGRFTARGALTLAYAAVGLCFLVLFSATTLPMAVAAATCSGVPGATALVVTGHHLQLCTPDRVRGRVSAAFQASDAVAAVAGALAAPALVALADLGRAVLVLSVAVLVAAAVAAILLPRSASRYRLTVRSGRNG